MLWNYIAQRDDCSVMCNDHKFLLSRHTFLTNDQDFGLIQQKKQYHSDAFVRLPHDWVCVVAIGQHTKRPAIYCNRAGTRVRTIASVLQIPISRYQKLTDTDTLTGSHTLWVPMNWWSSALTERRKMIARKYSGWKCNESISTKIT